MITSIPNNMSFAPQGFRHAFNRVLRRSVSCHKRQGIFPNDGTDHHYPAWFADSTHVGAQQRCEGLHYSELIKDVDLELPPESEIFW
jgi:hypothetical protein